MQPAPCLDDLRRERPDLSFAFFAMEPHGLVTLEIYADGQVFAFKGETEADAILAAFPQESAAPEAPAPQPPPDRSIFD